MFSKSEMPQNNRIIMKNGYYKDKDYTFYIY